MISCLRWACQRLSSVGTVLKKTVRYLTALCCSTVLAFADVRYFVAWKPSYHNTFPHRQWRRQRNVPVHLDFSTTPPGVVQTWRFAFLPPCIALMATLIFYIKSVIVLVGRDFSWACSALPPKKEYYHIAATTNQADNKQLLEKSLVFALPPKWILFYHIFQLQSESIMFAACVKSYFTDFLMQFKNFNSFEKNHLRLADDLEEWGCMLHALRTSILVVVVV